jgi:murein tripeptide amidase MpaA
VVQLPRQRGARSAPDLHIDNAGATSYPPGWKDYRAVATYDRQHFFRVPTDYDGKRLTIRHTPARDSVYYSYFAPYSHERHQDLIARSLAADGVRHELLGHTLDGRDMDLLTIDALRGRRRHHRPDNGRRTCWVIARQHPGETMAEWLVEGLLARLLDPEDPSPASCAAAPCSTSSPT